MDVFYVSVLTFLFRIFVFQADALREKFEANKHVVCSLFFIIYFGLVRWSRLVVVFVSQFSGNSGWFIS